MEETCMPKGRCMCAKPEVGRYRMAIHIHLACQRWSLHFHNTLDTTLDLDHAVLLLFRYVRVHALDCDVYAVSGRGRPEPLHLGAIGP